MRHFLHLAYRGARYHGWQVQPGAATVQGAIEQALATVLRRMVPITGAGRTDTGVNAAMMMAHADLPELDNGNMTPLRLMTALNAMLAPDIVIFDIIPVHDSAHARFDATARTYHYYANTRRDPFTYPLSWYASPNLDFEAMNTAAQLLIGRRDFTSFSKLHTDVKTNICNLSHARWVQTAPHSWRFEITADRFLRNMVRAVVGTLVDVGRHKMPPQAISTILERKDRCAAGTSMPAHALFLADIKYPYIN